MHCEINQVFELNSSELNGNSIPDSNESHLEFFWCEGNEIDNENLRLAMDPDENLPKPVIQLEFQLNVPWLLN